MAWRGIRVMESQRTTEFRFIYKMQPTCVHTAFKRLRRHLSVQCSHSNNLVIFKTNPKMLNPHEFGFREHFFNNKFGGMAHFVVAFQFN